MPAGGAREGAGRKSTYDPKYAAQADKLCRMGATDIELADFFDIEVRTLYRWKHDHEAFGQAIRAGKDALDDRVERSLYNRAVGYSYEAVKIFMPAGAKEPVYAPYREHVPPEPGAALNWLKNRRADVWREKSEVDVNVRDMAETIANRRKQVAEGRGDAA